MASKGSSSRKMVGIGAFTAAVIAIIAVAALAAYIYISDSGRHAALQQSYNELGSNYSALGAQYSLLQSQYDSLLSNYSSLQSRYDQIDAIANLQKSTILEANRTIHIDANGFESLQYSSSYAGYLEIQSDSDKPITFLLTNYAYNILMPYPATGASSNAKFIAPILDGDTFVSIFAPATSAVNVIISVRLVY